LIFVTIGGFRAFERLVCQADRIAGEIGEKVTMQIGYTEYEPQNCQWRRFMSRSEMDQTCAGARLVVSHAGTGSILTALEHSKPLVLVPRLKAFREVLDDHQLEIAREMQRLGITVVYDIADLKSALENPGVKPVQVTGSSGLTARLKEYLDRLEKPAAGDEI